MIYIMKYYTLLLLLISLVVQADVYRSVDKHGNVIFSDKATDNAEKIELQESYTYSPPVIIDLVEDEPSQPLVELAVPNYTVVIIAPSQNEPIRENAGNITVTSTVTPELNAERGDKLIFSLDGNLKSVAQDETSYTFTNVERGSHIAIVSVVDNTGKVIKSSKSILFHLQRAVARQ
tara:strand:- start:276 stop:806 length:531 start_codon:yes stop_codon:yes gene_type:complete